MSQAISQKTVAQWSSQLESQEVAARKEAADALAQLGDTGAAALAQGLKSKCALVRASAAAGLGAPGVRLGAGIQYSGALAALLKDKDAEVRGNAAWSLGRMGDAASSHADALAALLKDQSNDVRTRSIWALSQIGPAAVPHSAAVVSLLGDPDKAIANCAANLLVKMPGTVCADALAGTITDKNEDLRKTAIQLLRKMRETGTTALAGKLGDKDANVRRCAAEALGQIGTNAAWHSADLAVLLEDSKAEVRAAAAEALGRMGSMAEPFVSSLEARLEDKNADVRKQAAWALGQLGETAVPQIGALVLRLRDSAAVVRGSVAQALGRIGYAVTRADGAGIERALGDDLGCFGELELVKLLSESDTRDAAVEALTNLDACGAAALASQLGHRDIAVQSATLQGLSRMGHLGAAALASQLEHDDPGVRSRCAGTLGRFAQQHARMHVLALTKLLQDSDTNARKNAADALRNIGGSNNAVLGLASAETSEDATAVVLRMVVENIRKIQKENSVATSWKMPRLWSGQRRPPSSSQQSRPVIPQMQSSVVSLGAPQDQSMSTPVLPTRSQREQRRESDEVGYVSI